VFTNIPGNTAGDVPGDHGAGHYDRYLEDIEHMRRLGIDSYRLSLSWPRILPNGIGAVNEEGIAFYDRLLDGLLEAGIDPCVTLYHWDLPQALQERGGWPNRDAIEWFADYAALAFERFGDRVPRWATINEPIAMWVGYGMGTFAPGEADPRRGKQAMHNAMVAHGRAVQAFRASDANGEIGIVVDIWRRHPASDRQADRELAQRDEDDSFRFFFDELFAGGWSDRLRGRLERAGTMPDVHPGDFEIAGTPMDYMGINVYSRVVVSADNYNPNWWTTREEDQFPGGNYLQSGQEFYPRALSDAVAVLRDDYGLTLPVYITENGTSVPGEVLDEDGRIHDTARIAYLTGFLANAVDAHENGLDVRGYYVWTLLDDYEWPAAYTEKFGLIHVDLETMERKWKDSAYWFQEVCRTRRFENAIPDTKGTTPGLAGPSPAPIRPRAEDPSI
jgi:beta-glucosidase